MLHPLNDDAVTGLEPGIDGPAIIVGAAQLHRLELHTVFGIEQQHLGNAGAVTQDRALRTLMPSLLTACSRRTRTKLPGSKS